MSPIIPIESFSIFATGLDHPECLAFDADGFCYAGGEAGQIYRIAPEGGPAHTLCTLGGFTAGIAFAPDGQLLVCNPQLGLLLVHKNGSHKIFATHAGDHKLICPNFPLFDRAGNLYVTDSGNWRKQNGLLLRYTPDGHGEIVSPPLGYANGLALTADETRLFMVESDTNSIRRFDLSSNKVSRSSLFAQNVGRLPDGLTIDPAGNLLCSCYASDDIHRFSPDGQRREILAHDPFAILLSRPTNIVVRDNFIYAANLGRTNITRAPYLTTLT